MIEKDGVVSHVRVVRSAHPLLDAEALRVISECRNGNRLCQGGKAVRFEKTLPITFKYTPQETELTYEQYLKNLEEEQEMLKKGEKMSLEDMARRVNAFKEQLGMIPRCVNYCWKKSQTIRVKLIVR